MFRSFLTGVDDVTGEPLSQRDDDKPEVVKRRLEQHEQMTLPLVGHYLNVQCNPSVGICRMRFMKLCKTI